jgi:hypothetical protein
MSPITTALHVYTIDCGARVIPLMKMHWSSTLTADTFMLNDVRYSHNNFYQTTNRVWNVDEEHIAFDNVQLDGVWYTTVLFEYQTSDYCAGFLVLPRDISLHV